MRTRVHRSQRRSRGLVAVGAALAALFAGACSGSEETGGEVASGDQVAEGEVLYQANCASCHGSDLRGTPKGPAHLSRVYEPNHHGDEAFRFAIENGAVQHHWTFGDMPPVEGLSGSEVDAIIAYVRDVQQREGFE